MSGLLVKSTVIMKENLDVLNQRGVNTAVILGGAALTRRYVEEDCRRIYKGNLFYAQDAFDDLRIMEALAKGTDLSPFLHSGVSHDEELDELAESATVSGALAVANAAKQNTAMVQSTQSVLAPVAGSKNASDVQSATDVQSTDRKLTDGDKGTTHLNDRTNNKNNGTNDIENGTNDNNGTNNNNNGARVHESNDATNPNGKTDGPGIADGIGKAFSILRSDVSRDITPPEPPFWGTKTVEDVPLAEVFEHVNKEVLIRGQWRVRQGSMTKADYARLINTNIRPALEELEAKCIKQSLLHPRAVYGYFPCQSSGNKLIVYREDQKTEWLHLDFPRQSHGRHLCISDFFASVDEGKMDVLPAQIVTMGAFASEHAQSLFSADKYTEYLYFHGLSVESAEGLAEVIHKRIRAELGFAQYDALDKRKLFQQGYRGTRYSFGYPACPNLDDQGLLFELLQPQRIGIELTEEFELVPEQSTSAIIVPHPEAKYFNLNRSGAARSVS